MWLENGDKLPQVNNGGGNEETVQSILEEVFIYYNCIVD